MNLHHHHTLTTLSKPRPPTVPLFRHRKPIKRLLICFSSDSAHKLHLSRSLQSETLQILEWPALCAQLAPFTSTSMGLAAAQSARIPLGRTPEESKALLAQTSAAVAVPRPLDFSGIQDVSSIVDSAVAGNMLTVQELCLIKKTLRSARHLVDQLEGSLTDKHVFSRCSPLLEILQSCNFLMHLEEKIEFCVDCKFSLILDRASEELALIRSERKRNMENLDSMLKQTATQIFQAGGIDKQLVTKRRSRMCVAVRASHRSLLPDGIVLDVSSSGATYFVEPKEAINLNNEEVRLSDNEKIEERVILSILTSEIVQSKLDITHLLDRILDLDLAFARAAHAKWMGGVCPVLSSESCEDSGSSSMLVDIEGIQHPLLLESSLRKFCDLSTTEFKNSPKRYQCNDSVDFILKSPVPVDIKIRNNVKVVVISGPNTGGKTASMKTLGLASIMLKAGMYLPAQSNPQLPWFDIVLADVGDQQSIEQSLSTFSGHISRLRQILEATSEKSLVLIDEIGSGTDPSEGVALSASILQYIVDRVRLAIVTTHYADLTRLKEKDDRYENAAMEFSLKTLQPTYRMLWGSTGESNAINIAKTIGFDEKIIKRSEEWLSKLTPENTQMQKGLLYQSLMEERNRLEIQASKASSPHSDVMSIYNEIKNEATDLAGREAALKAKERQQIQKELKNAKMQIENIARDFENQLRVSDADQYNVLLKKSESAIAAIVEAYRPVDDPSVGNTGIQFYEPKPGENVHVKGLGNKLATVIETSGEDDMVLVQYGKVKVRVNKNSIRALENAGMGGAKASVSSSKKRGVVVRNLKSLRSFSETRSHEEVSYGPVVQTSKNTVDLRGMRGEEATHYLEMAINSRGPGSVLFVIHGTGTGVVKERALRFLKSHPRVAKFEQESPMNYGCTVAYIK